MSELLADTQAELGLADPGPLAGLSAAQLARLRDALRAAKLRDRAALDAAIASAMGRVPALLRGAVRRILFP